jgi:hypothetical protein
MCSSATLETDGTIRVAHRPDVARQRPKLERSAPCGASSERLERRVQRFRLNL